MATLRKIDSTNPKEEMLSSNGTLMDCTIESKAIFSMPGGKLESVHSSVNYQAKTLDQLIHCLHRISPNISAFFANKVEDNEQKGLVIAVPKDIALSLRKRFDKELTECYLFENKADKRTAFFIPITESYCDTVKKLVFLLEVTVSSQATTKRKALVVDYHSLIGTTHFTASSYKETLKETLIQVIAAKAEQMKKEGMHSFFSIKKQYKSELITQALARARTLGPTGNDVNAFLDYKSEGQMSVREALNYNRLLIKKEKTNTLLELEQDFPGIVKPK